jgi:hypothetical protein
MQVLKDRLLFEYSSNQVQRTCPRTSATDLKVLLAPSGDGTFVFNFDTRDP